MTNWFAMKSISRNSFLKKAAVLGVHLPVLSCLHSSSAKESNRFQIGIQEYTFHRWIRSGKLTHLDYPALAKDKLGITNIEYWNRPFEGRHTDQKYVGELTKRTLGEGMTNVLILVDAKHQLDAKTCEQRDLALEEHKAWVDCAEQLKCSAIRVNCRSGGDSEENLKNAVSGLRPLCEYAKGSGVKIAIEPHGGNSANPDWLVKAMKALDHPNAGLLPDFNNFGKYDRYDGVTKSLPYAVAVCAKALGFKDDGTEKHTDYHKMLKLVHDSRFSGVITIEFEGHDLDPIAGSLKTKALIEKALAAAGCS